MDWQKNRLWIGLVALVITGGAAFMAVKSGTGDSPASSSTASMSGFPDEVERDTITSLEITQPEQPTIRLVRGEGGWTLAAPVEARADQTSVDTALDKIAELHLESIAARGAAHHEELEVNAAQAIHVVANGEGGVLVDLWVGGTRSGNTAIRIGDADTVGMVNGSIRFAFVRELKDWRDRSITDVDATEVRTVAWNGPNGTFRFTRPMTTPAATEENATPEPTLGDWTLAEASYVPAAAPVDPSAPPPATPAAPVAPLAPVTTIENFQPSRVRTMVSTLARLRASDFAATDLTAATAGISETSPTVTLTVGEGSSATTAVLHLGNANGDQFYATRDGDETIFLVSSMHASRINPTVVEFQPSATPEPPAAPEGGGMPPGIEMGGAGGGEIPPEIMRQIQQQLQQQGAHP